jgi:ribose transport system permease protein
LLSGVVNGRAELAAPMIAAVLAIGLTIGIVNGALILVLRVHPLIVTLAVAAIVQGITLLYTLMPIGGMPDGFDMLAFGRVFAIPIGAAFSIFCFAVVAFVLAYLRPGRQIFALGGEPAAARLVGVPVRRVILFVYGLSGLLASLTGIYLVSRLGVGNPTGDTNYNLASITPVVLGEMLGARPGHVPGPHRGVRRELHGWHGIPPQPSVVHQARTHHRAYPARPKRPWGTRGRGPRSGRPRAAGWRRAAARRLGR